MVKGRCVVFCLWLIVFSAHAEPKVRADDPRFKKTCLSLINRVEYLTSPPPPPLRKNFVKPHPEEAFKAGMQLPKDWKPDRLNETYAFVIYEGGETWITPEFLGLPVGKAPYIGTHRSLVNLKEDPPGVIAAGELIVKNGAIVRVNNKSGTYWGNETNLKYSLNHFKEMGVRFDDNAIAQDFSKFSRKTIHTERLEILKQYLSPNFLELRARAEKVLKQLYDLYPETHPDRPGEIGSFVNDFHELMEKSSETGKYVPNEKYDQNQVSLAMLRANESVDYLVQYLLAYPRMTQNVLPALEDFVAVKQNQLRQTP